MQVCLFFESKLTATALDALEAIRREASHRFGLQKEISLAAAGSLPRLALKAKRITDMRTRA